MKKLDQPSEAQNKEFTEAAISRLYVKRHALVCQYEKLPRRESFSGWEIVAKIEKVDKEIESELKKDKAW